MHKTFSACALQSEQGKRPLDSAQLPVLQYNRFSLPDSSDKGWNWLRALLSRPWVTRIWVTQEAVLSTSALVVCGGWAASFDQLTQIVYEAVVLNLPVFPLPNTVPQTAAIRSFTTMRTLRRRRKASERFNLIRLLEQCRVASATDPHDYCYSLMGWQLSSARTEEFAEQRMDMWAKYLRSLGSEIGYLCRWVRPSHSSCDSVCLIPTSTS